MKGARNRPVARARARAGSEAGRRPRKRLKVIMARTLRHEGDKFMTVSGQEARADDPAAALAYTLADLGEPEPGE